LGGVRHPRPWPDVLLLISADIGSEETVDIQCVVALISVEAHR